MSTSDKPPELLPAGQPPEAVDDTLAVDETLAVDDTAKVASDDGSGCPKQLAGTPPADLYAAITRGSDAEKAQAALAILSTRMYSRAVMQRAIYEVSLHPECRHLRPLTDTLQDKRLDDATRSAAALALGTIAREFPCMFPGRRGR